MNDCSWTFRRKIWEADAKNFADKVKVRAVEKKKEMEAEKKQRRENEIEYMANNPVKPDRKYMAMRKSIYLHFSRTIVTLNHYEIHWFF